jgi:streptogramin lyase
MKPVSRALLGLLPMAGAVACSPNAERPGSKTPGSAASVVACPATSADAQCPTGEFLVTCDDGSTEVDTQQQIDADQVCLAGVFTEFQIPTELAVPKGITSGPDGNLWFAEIGANKIGRITPSGAITEFPANSPTGGIALGGDGNLWFAEGGKIGTITTDGVVTEFAIPTANTEVTDIASGPDGNLWFSEPGNADAQGGAIPAKIGRIITSGDITEFTLPSARAVPEEIASGPDGNVWFVELVVNSIGRVTPDGVITEFPIPYSSSSSYPEGIVSGPDGNVWFTDETAIWQLTPGGVFTQFATSSSSSQPLVPYFGIAPAPDGSLWFTVYADPSAVARVTTSGAFTQFSTPTADALPNQITLGPDGNLWFTEEKGNSIGRVTP